MTSWSDLEAEAIDLAAAVSQRFGAHLHHILATVRATGAPRLSGVEVRIGDGEVWLGMMPDSAKSRDLRRDPRLALHSAPVETDLKLGDAVIDGRAVEIARDAPDRGEAELALARAIAAGAGSGDAAAGAEELVAGADLFRVDLTGVSLVQVDGEELVRTAWRPGGPPTVARRR
ncbi:MAG: pyridoxamine 5'-phosphate oxidase family protein [Actinomycetota bacterium]|nr:pyridoxamine 5'-phosphate oxidase family protein [Actinomycetota bacterium]